MQNDYRYKSNSFQFKNGKLLPTASTMASSLKKKYGYQPPEEPLIGDSDLASERIPTPAKEVKPVQPQFELPKLKTGSFSGAEVDVDPTLTDSLKGTYGAETLMGQTLPTLTQGIMQNETGADWAETGLDLAAPGLMATGPIGIGAYAVGKLGFAISDKMKQDRQERNQRRLQEGKELEMTRNQQLEKYQR